MMTDLKAHLPVLDLISDGVNHLKEIIYEDEMYV